MVQRFFYVACQKESEKCIVTNQIWHTHSASCAWLVKVSDFALSNCHFDKQPENLCTKLQCICSSQHQVSIIHYMRLAVHGNLSHVPAVGMETWWWPAEPHPPYKKFLIWESDWVHIRWSRNETVSKTGDIIWNGLEWAILGVPYKPTSWGWLCLQNCSPPSHV